MSAILLYLSMMMFRSDINDTAYFAEGCFWCSEAIFRQVRGVVEATSGYSGGNTKNPTYKEVCTGTTGHAETIRVVYNPAVVSYETLLDIFWHSHDPTTLNRQGADEGTQYRSAIFYTNDLQKQAAQKIKAMLDQEEFSSKIVTEIKPSQAFYPAEDYHYDYYSKNKNQPYCQYVINPKLEKFKKSYKSLIK
jgi:peptide-methionine (S)-S-oxide reductase